MIEIYMLKFLRPEVSFFKDPRKNKNNIRLTLNESSTKKNISMKGK